MTKINRLILHGFKSFGKHTELVFDKPLNCVIGPNGSGKSNVLDSLCFVLGRSSSKALRAEKSANLIYNGGKTKQPAKEAEVSIFFDNTANTFPLPESEIKVTRIVRPNGQSIYKINNKTRTRQQVVDLLSVAKIDPEGYNIILQGDIIRFVEMSSIERRGLVEEIAGISIYEEKKQKAMNELTHVEEKLREADIILSERDQRLKELKKDRDHALKYKGIMEKINKDKASLLNIQIENKSSEKKEHENKIASQREKLDKLQAEMDELKKSISDKKSEIDGINREIESRGEQEQVKIHKEAEQLRVEHATSHNKLESYSAEIEKLKQRKQQLSVSIDEIGGKIKDLESQKKSIQQEISSNEKTLNDINKKVGDFRKKNKLDNLGDIEKEVDSIDRRSDEIQKSIQSLRTEQQELLRKKDKLEFQIQAIDEKIEKVLAIEKEHKEQLDDLKDKRNNFKKITLELNEVLTNDSSFAEQMKEARIKLAKANEEKARLEARSAGIQETLLGDMATKKILQQNKIKGIYGPVSELGEVSSRYSMALEVSAGSKIKGIVVEDDRVAAECIKYLKENRFGVATFFPLNKIKPQKMKDETSGMKGKQGVHGLAIELIKFDPKFRNVFSHVFGDTLVVDSIDVARQIGVGTVKMATLEGDLVEFSGAMQGGYRVKHAAGYGFKEEELEDNMKRCEETIKTNDTLIKALEKRRADNESKITKLRQEKASLEGEIIKIEKSLHLEEGDADVNKKLKQQIQQEIKSVEKEIEKVQSRIGDANSEITKLKVGKQELRDKISELRNPVLIAELNAFEEKRREVNEAIIQQTAELKNIDVQINTLLLPEKENIVKIIKQHEKEEEEFNSKIRELKERIKQMGDELKEKEKKEKQFYEQFKDLFNKRTKLDEEIKKKEGKLESFNENIKQVEIKMNTISLEDARVGTELLAMQKEFEQYTGIELWQKKPEEELRKDIKEAESFLAKMGESINMRALEIYEEVEKEYGNLLEKRKKLEFEKEDVLVMMNEIETKKKSLFMTTFDVINENFKNIFSALSAKGEAYLQLENKDSPFDGGLLVKVRITGNKFLDIRSLSGGEKTMTALAFIFSIQEHEPASFYVFDEVDAALDKHNSEKLAKLIRKYSERAQYLIMSHNDALISEADNIYGVSMDENGVSKVVSLRV